LGSEQESRGGYALISPCRNEAEFARRTLDSVIAQSERPDLWVIVDDGSSDATPQILAEYAARHSWIQVVRCDDRGRRCVGRGVIDAFNAGLERVDLRRHSYVCKLDLDLELPRRYFEILMSRMDGDPTLGTCSGKAYFVHPRTGRLVSEAIGDDMSVGASKFYRTECFCAIGGFVAQVMWDGIDCHRCRMLGWRACSWDEPELRMIHLRPMGSTYKSIFHGRMSHGEGQYYMGTGLTYMTASAIYRMTRPPVVLGGVAMWWGYVLSALRRMPRCNDRALRSFVRRYQWTVLLRGRQWALRNVQRWIRKGDEAKSRLDACSMSTP
jgi:poly-beta-1,6-N-acetyl-D-glucosamine synthase